MAASKHSPQHLSVISSNPIIKKGPPILTLMMIQENMPTSNCQSIQASPSLPNQPATVTLSSRVAFPPLARTHLLFRGVQYKRIAQLHTLTQFLIQTYKKTSTHAHSNLHSRTFLHSAVFTSCHCKMHTAQGALHWLWEKNESLRHRSTPFAMSGKLCTALSSR